MVQPANSIESLTALLKTRFAALAIHGLHIRPRLLDTKYL
jgi:hypothetical protein